MHRAKKKIKNYQVFLVFNNETCICVGQSIACPNTSSNIKIARLTILALFLQVAKWEVKTSTNAT